MRLNGVHLICVWFLICHTNDDPCQLLYIRARVFWSIFWLSPALFSSFTFFPSHAHSHTQHDWILSTDSTATSFFFDVIYSFWHETSTGTTTCPATSQHKRTWPPTCECYPVALYAHWYLANFFSSFEYSALSSCSMTIHVPLPSIIEFHNHLLQHRFNAQLQSLFTCTHTTAATHMHKWKNPRSVKCLKVMVAEYGMTRDERELFGTCLIPIFNNNNHRRPLQPNKVNVQLFVTATTAHRFHSPHLHMMATTLNRVTLPIRQLMIIVAAVVAAAAVAAIAVPLVMIKLFKILDLMLVFMNFPPPAVFIHNSNNIHLKEL